MESIFSLFPGVRAGDGRVAADLCEAAEWAQAGAQRAAERGTFCVGGVLLGPGRELLAESSNHVLCDGQVCDPTAHGERQLVDWYLAQRGLPPADVCTVVSTLDPCMMCTGALLQAGFQVVTLALDPDAGVNCAGDGSFGTLPVDLRPLARRRFAYLGVEGRRPPFGCDLSVTAEFERRSYDLFQESLKRVQSLVHSRSVEFPAELVWRAEAAALLAGKRVVAVGSVMELARRYPFRDLTLVQRRGPDLSPRSIMEMGAYGSCVEGPLPPSSRAGWQYLEPACSQADLQAQLQRMPRHYREVVGLRIEQAGWETGDLVVPRP